MRFLYDLFPLLLFFGAFKYYGIYVATAVAIIASFAQVTFYWLRHRRFEAVQLITLAVIAVFGGLTLALHDDTFIKWKPTLVYWILAAFILGSQWLGKKTLIERMMSEQITLPAPVWKRLNLSWVIFFVLLGAVNIYVAFYYRLDLGVEARRNIWVNFKLFGLMGLTFFFVIVQAFYMARHIQNKPENGEPDVNRTVD
ncbi:MAG: septation protein A [Sulfuricaulis sp.]